MGQTNLIKIWLDRNSEINRNWAIVTIVKCSQNLNFVTRTYVVNLPRIVKKNPYLCYKILDI